MHATSGDSGVQCFNCEQRGHRRRDGPQPLRPKPKEQQQKHKKKHWKKAGGEPGPKWCSLHKRTNHSDTECFKQKATNDKGQGVSTIPILGAPTSPKQKSTMSERSGSPPQVVGSLRSSRLPTTQRNLRRRLIPSSPFDLHQSSCSRRKQLIQDYSQRSEKLLWQYH